MPLLSPNHNYAADECIAQIPQHHIPTAEEKVRASENFDKDVLVAAHMAALHDAYILEMGYQPVNEVTIKPSSPTSSIGGLKPSTLKQLKVGKVHRRRVLNGILCVKTLCTKSHNGLMVVNVFEDEEGKATPIYISNAMDGNGSSAQAQRLYPQDSKVAVKEPYLTRLPDGEIVLLVEKTTDLVFLWVPEFVEENRTANEGSKANNGLHENGRDVFTIKKMGDVSVNNGDCNENEGKDGVVEEGVKSAKTCLELKFEDLMYAKEENGSVEIATNVGCNWELQGDVEKKASVENVIEDMMNAKGKNGSVKTAIDGRSNTKLEDDVEEKASVENVIDGENSMEDIVGVNKKEGEVEVVAGAKEVDSRELSLEDMPSMCKGAKVEAVIEEGSRELSLEDMVAMRKGERNGGDAEVHEADTREIDKVGVKEETLKEDGIKAFNQGKLGNSDAGETASRLRTKGNAIFALGDFNNAASIYMRAAEKARSDGLKMEELLCLSNRAEVWLRLCRNQAAYDDAEAALKLLRECDGVNAGDLALAKALFRKGRALMGLRKYEDAMRVLQEVLVKAPADRQLREAAIKCRKHVEHVLKPGKRQRAAANRKKMASLTKQ